eukprot:TRINITY_DN4209_c0_g1_i1.p1 TRINITY_DN4209_c0_g1~~TRINITY_DN4209_c0_g1_i1.p1  ORF type:complete len:494 (+),score=123.69 TRINITY_DN4209_c0_g1_i1:22-1503(+)
MLGIEFHTRRRNRANGKITSVVRNEERNVVESFVMKIDQTFGNCPKYIQAREFEALLTDQPITNTFTEGEKLLTESQLSLVARSDTLFIASSYKFENDNSKQDSDATHGVDISHRGGKPGFVKVSISPNGNHVMEFPDYLGNFMFNTVGNLISNPNAGLLFLDFENGNVLSITGKATVLFDEKSMPGAQRMIRFEAERWVEMNSVLPFRWNLVSNSPYLPELTAEEGVSSKFGLKTLKVQCVDVKQENQNVKTYTFSTGLAIAANQIPGQYATFEIRIGDEVYYRTWTISSVPIGASSYNISISVKKQDKGVISNWLWDNMVYTKEIYLKGIEGTFHLNALKPDTKNLLMFAGGIGITPLLSMLRSLFVKSGSVQPKLYDNIDLFYSVKDLPDLVFGDELVEMAESYKGNMKVHFVLSQPTHPQWPGAKGRIKLEDVKSRISELHEGKTTLEEYLDKTEAFICGPDAFMQHIESILQTIGLAGGRIHTEKFNF